MPLSLPEARALYDSGAPVTHVAAQLEMSADAFRRMRLKENWPLRPSPIARPRGEAAVPQTKSPKAASPKAKSSKTKSSKTKTSKTKTSKVKSASKRRPTRPAAPLADGALAQVDAPPANLPQANLPQANPPHVNLPAFRQQVADATQRELAKVHKTLASGKTEDVERNARLLASLVKSLAELRRLEALDPLGGAPAPAVEGQDDQRPPRDLDTLRDELARALERMSGEPGGPGAGE